MPWPSLTRWFVLALVVLLTGAASLRLERRLAPRDLPGLAVDGMPIPDGVSAAAFISARAAARLHRRVRLTVNGEDVAGVGTGLDSPDHSVSLGELGVIIDEARVVGRVACERSAATWYERMDRAKLAAGGGIDVPLQPGLDFAIARPIVERIKEWADRSPVSARLDLDHHQVVGEKAGVYVDAEAALAAIRDAAESPTSPLEPSVIVIPTRSFPPHMSRAFVEKVDVGVVMAEYATGFSRAGDQARRGKNIDVAASKIDGLVLAPGELVSFNAIVGERSEDNGFQKSWEIFKGEMVEGVGGGTCQVASTFYAALFFGGLEITERLPHSRPSAYIPMGLDATVVYPTVDLKVRNPYDFPVVVHATVAKNQLKMQLLGARKPAKVSFAREVVRAYAYPRKVNLEPRLRYSKRVVLKQHGIRGYKIKRTRTLVFKDGTHKKEENTDLYPATAEIYDVPPDFDVAELPPMPADNVDTKEGDDAKDDDEEQTPATPEPAPAAALVTCKDDCSPALLVTLAPGAHEPTLAQAKPAKTLTLTR